MILKRLPAFLRTTTFRLTILSAGLFAASAALIVFYIYNSTARALALQTDRAIAVEVSEFSAKFSAAGPNGLNQEVIRRRFSNEGSLYSFAYATGRLISGNLDPLPDDIQADGKVVRFTYAREVGASGEVELRRARGALNALPGGYVLLVGRDVHEDEMVVARVARQTWTATGLILILGLLTGAFISRRFSSRLDGLNAVARDVMAGDLKRRAPRNHTGDELDTLSQNLNAMLDRIERLMLSMRHAGDAVAHDLRSPLTRLRARLESALLTNDADPKEVIQTALGDADELLTTFNAVLRLARLEAGEQRSELVDVELGPLIADLAELYEPACEDAGLEMLCEIEADRVVRADASLISQAVSNLLDNAVKYTPEGGAIAVRVRRRSSGRIEISITDTGHGIPAEDRERVVQRFVRLEVSRSAPGSGLGLSLVQAIAELHGARLELEDGPGSTDGEGFGLRVALIFPKAV